MTSRLSRRRNAFASKHCVVAHRHTPGWLGSLVVHLRPQLSSPPTRRYQTIPSAIVANRYHHGRGADDTNNRVVAQVEGTGPVLPILEGGHRVCLLSFGLHKLWQRLLYLDLGNLNLRPTLAPPPLPQVFNKPTASILSGVLVASYHVSEVRVHLGRVVLLPLRSGRLI